MCDVLVHCLVTFCREDFVKKRIYDFPEAHRSINGLALLQELYSALAARPDGIIHLHSGTDAGPRVNSDGTYIVHLSPVGEPCSGPPNNEASVKAAVLGALKGLAVLHAAGGLTRSWV